MSKIFIRETMVSQAKDFDREILFLPRETNEYLDEKADFHDYEGLFENHFRELHRYLERKATRSLFLYRGVDVLWCFKKELSDFSDYSSQRYAAFKRLSKEFPFDELYLKENPFHPKFPRLFHILSASIAGIDTRIHWLKQDEGADSEEIFPVNTRFKDRIWPAEIKTPHFKSYKTVIYSDYERSKSVLSNLPSGTAVFLTRDRAPKILFKSVARGAGFYQTVSLARNGQFSNITQQFLGAVLKSEVFSGVYFNGLDAAKLLRPKLMSLFEDWLPKLLDGIDKVHLFFQKNKNIKTALLDEDITPDKSAFCQVARQYSVVTFVECHGALGFKNAFLPLTADRLFAWGEDQKNKLIFWGASPGQVIVSGCSRYSEYRKLKIKNLRGKIAARYRLDPSKKIILVALHPIERLSLFFENTIQNSIETVLSALTGFPELQFILKIHTGDQYAKRYELWVKEHKMQNCRIIRQADPMILAKACDFLIVYLSTYALDGFAMDKNVILFKDRLKSPLEEIERHGIFYEAMDRSGLIKAIKTLCGDPLLPEKKVAVARKACLNDPEKNSPERLIAEHLQKNV